MPGRELLTKKNAGLTAKTDNLQITNMKAKTNLSLVAALLAACGGEPDFDSCRTTSCCREAYDECISTCNLERDNFYRNACYDNCEIQVRGCYQRVSR